MKPGERARVRFVFFALGCVPVFLAGWLGYVQVLQAAELPRDDRAPLPLVAATADRQGARAEILPAPRGMIVDRHGVPLALDREVYEVRARIVVPNKARATVLAYLSYFDELARDLARAMVSDPLLANRSHDEAVHRETFLKLFAKEFRTPALAGIADPATAALPDGQAVAADLRLVTGVDQLAIIEALREVEVARSSLALDFLHTFERDYPERALTQGFVGHVDTVWTKPRDGSAPKLLTLGRCGLETADALRPAESSRRRFRQDGKGRPYFLAPLLGVEEPNVLHATLDLELQRVAHRELETEAEAVAGKGSSTMPLWGALVLVEIETGDVLAAASWHRDEKRPQQASWTPYQSLFEPGSIVKPLVLAYALAAGRLDWNHAYDCASGSSEYQSRIASKGRRNAVKDDHACGVLTPHGIIVNSSNIGASYVGLELDRDQWLDYMRGFGFGASLGLSVPHERVGGASSRSFGPRVSERSFQAYSAISFSFGYELEVTPLHIARAYLRLFRGMGSELRVSRGAEIDGVWTPNPVTPPGRKLPYEVIDAVRLAMVDVVSADPHATGSKLHAAMLAERGIDLHGLLGGKTGTAASHIGMGKRGRVEVRNASFVGFMPAEAPRWLAVGILQKDDSAKFYGGSYAAPPTVRLLLEAQRLSERRLLRQGPQGGSDGQVRTLRATPGDTGWGRGASETTSVGR